MLRILHTADLHVGTPFKLRASQLPDGAFEQLRLAAGTVLQRIVDYAIDQRVDAVIIAGDLFDEADPPVSVQYDVLRQFRRLSELDIPVILSHGNHDPVGAASLFPWPSTVHVLGTGATGERVCDIVLPLSGYQVQFSGFSYLTREVYGSKVAQFARRDDVDIAIALYHGQVGSASGPHAPYAATSLGKSSHTAISTCGLWAIFTAIECYTKAVPLSRIQVHRRGATPGRSDGMAESCSRGTSI
ncbi:metallophosphoesterase family protein [Alicyclobacillus fastidiosus]|uniref:metallophosphoesterase family protein n=1 Tax=Alicyclobacillus fastidiosus TaxID=392011 RepID=UPI0023E9B8A7|nr:DNA repair exonuclease [Alicyclobacillus fastidiosus]GMA59877.1 hypothetical protein GCM10025859_03170 [Alicyclobacillus fastidiosus]